MTRTPLLRFTPLKRTPLRRVSARARAKSAQWRRVTAAAIAEAHGRCVVQVPGVCTGTATAGHHIQPRAQGGSYDGSNVAAVCAACHAHIHGNPAWSYANGWLVRREGGGDA